jgi:hypothetical protein
MTPEELLKALGELTDGLRADMAKHCETMNAKYDAVMDAVKKKKADDDGDDETMATRTAADSVSRAEFEATQAQLRALQIAQPARKSQATLDQFADLQAKADVAYRSLGESASPPMSGEGLIEYQIRLHRPLLKHSKKFKAAELAVIARDQSTLNSICDSVRADAVEAAMSPVGMPEFQHRMITEQMPTGHTVRRFVGNGTIFKQMSRPARHVRSIGADDRYPRSGGGQVFAAQ